MSASLLNAEDIASFTGLTKSDIPQEIVDWAEQRVEQKLGKDYGDAKTSSEEYMFYESTDMLKVKHQNIVSVSSLTIEDIDEEGLDEDNQEFYVFKEDGIIQCDSFVTYKKINITYTYGNNSVEDLDKYLHLLYTLKQLIISYPDLIPKEELSESIGDYSVSYNVSDLKKRPDMIDDEINKVISDKSNDQLFFI